MIIFGPVPSRRLGQSLGINNIPPKQCSYSCIYCQLGRTEKMKIERSVFYKPEDIYNEMKKKMVQVKENEEIIDYVTFVSDGEPTLDKNLGIEIDYLKEFGIKIAVITNSSLLWMDEVKQDLMKADWVSLKIDAMDKNIWKLIDRPHGYLDLDRIIESTLEFANIFKGVLVTETMLVKGFNDNISSITEIGEHIKKLKPSKAYLLVPTRPPAELIVERPSTNKLKEAYTTIQNIANVKLECITEDEGESFFFSANEAVEDLLSIMSVHPVKENIINKMLIERNLDWTIIDKLVEKGVIKKFTYENKKFFKKI